MSRRKISIALFVGALVVFAGSTFFLVSGHNKRGIGLIVLGVLLVNVGVAAFLSRSSTEEWFEREWI